MTANTDIIEQLVAYSLGELPETAARNLADRLAESDELRALAEQVRQALDALRTDQSSQPPRDAVQHVLASFRERRSEPAASESWIDKAGRIVAQLVFDSRLQPAVSGFRGSDDASHLLFESRVGNVDLRLTPPDPRTRNDWRIQGQVSDNPDATQTDVMLLDAISAENIATTSTNERGYFNLQTRAGHYDVLIQLPGETLALEDLRVG